MPSHVAVALFDTLLTELAAAACTALKPSEVRLAAADACRILSNNRISQQVNMLDDKVRCVFTGQTTNSAS
jgi:hypothetical protein